MIKNKNILIRKIKEISDNIIKQGIEFRNLALSIEKRREEKTLKEWIDFIQPILGRLENEKEVLKNGRREN